MDQNSNIEVESWKLPVGKIKNLILTCFENLNKSFAEEMKSAITYGPLISEIQYVDAELRADSLAQNVPEGEKDLITIYEPYLAFLWCFCYLFITFRATQRPNDQVSEEKLRQAIALFEYGLSLFKDWTMWDLNLPNPALYDKKEELHITEVNTLFCYSAAFCLCHEFAHSYYGHVHAHATDSKADELLADSYALEIFIEGLDAQGEIEKESKRLGALISLSSILFTDSSWDGGTTHPDADERLKEVMNSLAKEPDDSLWAYGVLVISLWGIAYQNSCLPFSPDLSIAKAEFNRLVSEIKALQAEQSSH